MIEVEEVTEQEDGSAVIILRASGKELEILLAKGFISVLERMLQDNVAGTLQD